jgi:hypothetical protein
MDKKIDCERKKIIDSFDWGIEYPKFVGYGLNICKIYGIFNKETEFIGESIEDIVSKVILKLISGDRIWDHEMVNIHAWIINSIRSEVYNLFNKKSTKNEIDEIDDEFECVEFNLENYGGNEQGFTTDPLRILVNKQELELTAKELLELASNDELIEKMIYAILEGVENKAEIMANYLGVDIQEIYNANKRIVRIKKYYYETEKRL